MIFTIRGVQVMIDRDLATVYAVETRVLNQAVKRNIDRFPKAFRFQLTQEEYDELVTQCGRFNLQASSVTTSETKSSLRSPSVTLKTGGGRGQHRKYLPYVFTEQGGSMLSAVQDLSHPKRWQRLNGIAIGQMRLLTEDVRLTPSGGD
jgi:hypothetical protein